jgi:alkaline phosphatase D
MDSRRQFLARSGALAAAAVLAPQDALAAKKKEKRRSRANLIRGGTFPQGVLSGDPAPDAVTVLTLLGGVGGAGRVRLEVARDPGFRRVVATRDILTTTAVNHAVKARVTGLEPHERYWYRFETRDHHSPVGRLQTALAPGSQATVRFGFFSCADFAHGYYNAYEALAREDLDFVVSLGDYVYAETYMQTGDGRAVRDDPIGRPNPYFRSVLREAATLDEYRAKYALYRTDPALRKLHQTFPVVATWDDHEVQNNYANDAEDGGLPLRARFSRARRDAAYQAYFESMPVFGRGKGARIYRSEPHGRTVELFMLDERQYRQDQPCGDAIRLPCSSWDRQRTILGRRQFDWLKRRLLASDAAWKVIGGQSLMMGNRVHDGEYQRYDSWQGYPRERERLLAHLVDRGIKDVVFLAGDIHTTVAGDVCTAMGAGPSVAVEFAAGSITSPAPGEANYRLPARQLVPGNDANPRTPPDILAHYRAINPWVDALDLDRHGYGIVTASPSAFDVTLQRIWTIKERGNIGTMPATGFRWQVKRGQTSIRGTAV